MLWNILRQVIRETALNRFLMNALKTSQDFLYLKAQAVAENRPLCGVSPVDPSS
jgi:hypothetical protein